MMAMGGDPTYLRILMEKMLVRYGNPPVVNTVVNDTVNEVVQ